jgi:hypothetical protein
MHPTVSEIGPAEIIKESSRSIEPKRHRAGTRARLEIGETFEYQLEIAVISFAPSVQGR